MKSVLLIVFAVITIANIHSVPEHLFNLTIFGLVITMFASMMFALYPKRS